MTHNDYYIPVSANQKRQGQSLIKELKWRIEEIRGYNMIYDYRFTSESQLNKQVLTKIITQESEKDALQKQREDARETPER